MSTYSIGNPPTDAEKLSDLQSVFNVLLDNTSKQISPKYVRDAIYTLWENNIFKPTGISGSSVEYIGIDQDFVKEKIYIGNKKINNSNVLNNDLLNTDVDIFLSNTRADGLSNYNTKIAILAGTGSNYFAGDLASPYIEASVVTTPYGNYINFNIVNKSRAVNGLTSFGGDINIKSDWGNISLNGVILPTYAENNNSSLEGYSLVYRWNSGTPTANWEQVPTQSVVGSATMTFTESTPVPTQLGGIAAGETFSNVPIDEMLRRLLYPYIPPTISISITPALIESGNTFSVSSLLMDYTAVRTSSTASITFFNTTLGSVSGSFNTVPVGSTSGVVTPLLFNTSTPTAFSWNLSGTQSYVSWTWSVSISDSIGPTSVSSDSIGVVLPWYYGSSSYSATASANINAILGTSSTYEMSKLTPIITNPALSPSSSYNKTLVLKTLNLNPYNQGYLYFGYPADFPDLAEIIDPNNYNVISSFQKYVLSNIDSPNSYWSGKDYKFYIYTNGGTTPVLTTIGSYPTYSGTYQFKFI